MDLFGGVGFSHVCNYMYDKEWLEDDQGVGEQDANAFWGQRKSCSQS